MLIYLLGLAASLGIIALARYDKFSWQYALMSAIILFAFTMIRLFVNQLPVSLVAHIILLAIAFYLPYGATIHKYMIAGFALLLLVVDMNDFYKKKNQSYGVIHVASCSVFLLIFAYVDYAATKVAKPPKEGLGDVALGAKYNLFATFVCLICIAFFAFILIRAYVANAIKLADNSQIDENAPVDYMYGNSNKFIGFFYGVVFRFVFKATADAHAPVPQASVSPAPRSHTRILTLFLSITCTNSVFIRFGKHTCSSNFGPSVSSGTLFTLSTNTTQWGLPMDTHVTL